MNAREQRWNELQERWARGDVLSADEERERLAFAAENAPARRELELFAELSARGRATEPIADAALIARVLDEVKGGPRLRLVAASNTQEPRETAHLAEKRGRSWTVALALSLVAASGVLLFRAVAPESPPVNTSRSSTTPSSTRTSPAINFSRTELVLAAGQVSVQEQPARLGQRPLAEGESVSTADGRACLTIDPGIDVCLAEHTTIALESLAPQRIRVSVMGGTALAALSPRKPGSTFSLVTGDVSAVAHGTIYALHRAPAEAEVTVLEGEVDVGRQSRPGERVEAHSKVVVPEGSGVFSRSAVGRNEEARLHSLRAPHRLWSGPTVGVLELADGSGARSATVDDEPTLPLPLRVFVAAGSHRIGWQTVEGSEATSWVEVKAGETERLTPPVAPQARRQSPSKPSPSELLQRARQELARAKPREALAMYEELRASYPSSAESRTVLVTMGKLELDLGQPGRALSHFQAYEQSGGGALTPEALAGQAKALRALGRRQEERRALERYLAVQPRGFDAPVLRKRLSELTAP